MSWKEHITLVNCKLRKGIGILSKIRDLVPKNVLKSLYYSFIQPFVDYNLLNWNCTPTTNLECIRVSLKKAVRIISFKPRQEHSAPLFKERKILPLDQQINLKRALCGN